MEQKLCDEDAITENSPTFKPQDNGASSLTEPEIRTAPRTGEGNVVAGEVRNQESASEMRNDHEDVKKASCEQTQSHVYIIDIRRNSDGTEEQEEEDSIAHKVCRICHLSPEHQPTRTDLIHLGCRCKDELGISHRHCAETWFKHKGNRLCEICGSTASNVIGTREPRVVMQGNQRRVAARSSSSSTFIEDREVSGCGGYRFCNLLSTCLVLAFILPWFIRFDIFR